MIIFLLFALKNSDKQMILITIINIKIMTDLSFCIPNNFVTYHTEFTQK